MASPRSERTPFGAATRPVDLSAHCNWPRRLAKEGWWRDLAEKVRTYPEGEECAWGIPFDLPEGATERVILIAGNKPEVVLRLNRKAAHLCFLHAWEQLPDSLCREDPTEGLAVGEYVLIYADGSRHMQPVRGRFEVAMAESPGPPWLAVPFNMPSTIDPSAPPDNIQWGLTQYALHMGHMRPQPPIWVYAMPNPRPEEKIRSLVLRGTRDSPLLVAGLTLYEGAGHPFAHLPRRTYRVNVPGGPAKIEEADIDQGIVARVEHTSGPRGKRWLNDNHAGVQGAPEPERGGEDLLELVGAEDATVSVTLEGKKRPATFSLGEAFHDGKSRSGKASLEVLGQRRQWMQVEVIDKSTGKPTPVRIHFSGSRGEYLAPYGHHAQINTNWFEDYGADVVAGGRSYAYVSGEFTTDLPVGDAFVEINKGYEYAPVRRQVCVKPGQKELRLAIDRWTDQRSAGWVTADTHVHFISPQTAWLEGQAEGVNVVNLLASQWGRLFTNVGDLSGRVGVVENDTVVYVGTENRNHMLGHMSMLGTKGLPVYPMCCGGPSESWVGDPDFILLAEWARENKRKGGVVIRPHFPYCGHTEDPVPILNGLVDALEIGGLRGTDFPTQEWYRYLNCGYRVAVAGGTDKMGAATPLGWLRTYAKLDPSKRFTYDRWAAAVRAGRTFATTGPVIDLHVDGNAIGDTIRMSHKGGRVEVRAEAQSCWPLGVLELVYNGRVLAFVRGAKNAKRLVLKDTVKIPGSGWIAARCAGYAGHPAGYMAAHTSPVYVTCGDSRAFSGPAAEHMLALVEGGIEYLNTVATLFDERSRKRMVKLFNEARAELKGRLVVEGGHTHHHGHGPYHTHGHGTEPGHRH